MVVLLKSDLLQVFGGPVGEGVEDHDGYWTSPIPVMLSGVGTRPISLVLADLTVPLERCLEALRQQALWHHLVAFLIILLLQFHSSSGRVVMRLRGYGQSGCFHLTKRTRFVLSGHVPLSLRDLLTFKSRSPRGLRFLTPSGVSEVILRYSG